MNIYKNYREKKAGFYQFSTNIYFAIVGIMLPAACKTISEPPNINLKAYPLMGDTSTYFEFNAGESYDDTSYDIALKYRWDLDGDGVWDTGYQQEKILVRQFPNPGNHVITAEVIDIEGLTAQSSVTIRTFGRNPDLAQMIDPRDHNAYTIVRIENRWWMAEDLRFGIAINPSSNQTDNGITERYEINSINQNHPPTSCYNWFEAMDYNYVNPKGICPEGWHIPRFEDWQSLYYSLPSSYILNYYGQNGLSGLNLHTGITLLRPQSNDIYQIIGWRTFFWSSSSRKDRSELIWVNLCQFKPGPLYAELNVSPTHYNKDGVEHCFPIRCIKDQD